MECSKCGRNDQLRRGLCHACYERDRRAGRIDSLVSAQPARQHIALLATAGWHYREITRAANIDGNVVHRIRNGRERINAKTALAICGINIADLQRCQRSGVCADPKARAAKSWATRKAKAQRITEQRSKRLSHAAQHARQVVIMAERRRQADRRREVANPPRGVVLGMPTGSWVNEALCVQVDPDMFFPDKGGSTRAAKKVCLGCPVRQRCLDWALSHEEWFGIWGGASERERRRMTRGIA